MHGSVDALGVIAEVAGKVVRRRVELATDES